MIADKMMSSAPVTWRRTVERLSAEEICEAARDAAAQAVRAARIAAYVNARELDRTHDQAVVASNAVVAKVRKALGFTIDRDDLNF